MKKTLVTAIFLVFFFGIVNAADLNQLNISVNIDNNELPNFEVTYVYDSPVTKSDYFIFSKISAVQVMADGRPFLCSVSERSIGTSITCEGLNATNITYQFTAWNLISKKQDFEQFSHRFPIVQITKRFDLEITLPLGYVLVDKDRINSTGFDPFEPKSGKEGSDGRQIFIDWSFQNPELGKSYDVSVYYEPISPVENSQLLLTAVVSFVSIIILSYIFMRKRHGNIMLVLTDEEKKVMELVMKDKKGIDQKSIVKTTDFSKTKVSRIIQNLANRNLIEKIPKGRNNIIKMKSDQKAKKEAVQKDTDFKI